MARKKKDTVVKFPGPWENLHTLIKNLEGDTGTREGYVLITVPSTPETPLAISENYSGATKAERKFIRDVLEDLADRIWWGEDE